MATSRRRSGYGEDGRSRCLRSRSGRSRRGRAKPLTSADLHLAADDLDTAWEFAGELLGVPRLGTPAQELPVAAAAARIIGKRRRAAGDATLQSDDESRLRAVLDRDVWPTQALWRALVDAELGGDDGAGSDPALWLTARAAAEAPETPITNRLLVELGLGDLSWLARRPRRRGGHSRGAAGSRGRARCRPDGRVGTDAHRLGQGSVSVRSRYGPGEGLGVDGGAQQVLDLVAEGLTNGQIAGSLDLSPKTVAVHVSAILRQARRIHAHRGRSSGLSLHPDSQTS